jgi:hypothetical protein
LLHLSVFSFKDLLIPQKDFIMLLLVISLLIDSAFSQRDAGILYEVWHTYSGAKMAKIAKLGGTQLTTELVIESQGSSNPYSLDDVFGPYNISGDIYGAQPQLGFYCLWRPRDGDPPPNPPTDECSNISYTAERHATMLLEAGFDYIAIDITNWPIAGNPGELTDTWVLRPTQVLFEEWLALRNRGIPTPKIAVWPCSPAGSTTWKWLLDTLYNNASYADLIYMQDGKQIVFIPYAGANCYDVGEEALIRANGGLNNVQTIPMWALFGGEAYKEGAYGFFSPCRDSNGGYTTSMVGENVDSCDQFITYQNGTNNLIEITASGGYMTSQCALPFASPGHLRGLTAARLFEQVLARSPPHLFMSSFNEYIGGRQAPAFPANTAINMGLANDTQRAVVWVDSYAAEFSRDIEPSVEGGNRTWLVVSSCVNMYKQGLICDDAHADELCCTRDDKEVYANIWSLARTDSSDFLLTQLLGEREALVQSGNWKEKCSPICCPSAFCVDSSIIDGRQGPFMVFNTSSVIDYVNGGLLSTRALYRCYDTITHFFSIDPLCEGATTESTLGYIQTQPGNEMLRPLYRCKAPNGTQKMHALDLQCDLPDGDGKPLGYVR